MTTTSIYKTPAGEQAVMALYDTLLANWPNEHQRLTVPTCLGDTFVIAAGERTAPPLLLLHGAGTNSAIWAGDFPAYSQSYRVYAVDLPGEPGKSAPSRPSWEGPAYVQWQEDVLAALGVERASLTGISQGGWTALKFAVQHPEQVERLALICPGGIRPDRLSFILKAVGLSLLGRWGSRRMVRLLFADQDVPEGTDEIMTTVTTHFKARTGILPIFSDEELRRLTMPVLLLGGAQDALRDTAQIAERLRALAPRLSVVIIPEAGHAVVNTRAHIMPFLANGHPNGRG